MSKRGHWSIFAALLAAASAGAQPPTSLSGDDKTAIQALVTSYAGALGECRAEDFADLFVPETGYFASGFRGRMVGREHLIALVQSERHCTAPAGAAEAARPGGTSGPTVAIEAAPTGARGVANLGTAEYQDEYAKTPAGWRFASRTVIVAAEKAAGIDARDLLAIERLGGAALGDGYEADQNGGKGRLLTSGVRVTVSGTEVTGRAFLKDGGYNDEVYEKLGPGNWRVKSSVHVAGEARSPIVVEKQGAFAIGGRVLGDAAASLHCDHGVVEYQIPPNARAVNLLMWHSASAVAWAARWDGGEGFQTIFVRRGFPVYIWDGPRVGRANWGCGETTYEPGIGRDQQNFVAWRFGAEYPNWFDGVQFPKDDPEAFNQAMRARYQEFDIVENIHLQSDAAAALVDKIGPTVALTNSAGGLRALMTAIKSDNIKGIVMYENVGYVFPEGELPPGLEPGGFGPLEVPLEDFRKLTRIPLQAVWGDNVGKSETYSARLEQAKRFVEVVNKYGGKAEILMLRDAGLSGNTHIPFADMNNIAVADLLSKFLETEGLSARRK